ncbi:MAG TPA: hypothetical protein VKH37_13050, partial [Ferruginibacter sp.]|nr:hypothetical protein [Ferruginibacter sp.]
MITRLSIVLFTCIAFSVAGHAQQRVVNDAYLLSKRESDSVKRLLPGTADDILKVNRLIYVAQKQSEEDQLNLDYSRNALLLSEKLQYTE